MNALRDSATMLRRNLRHMLRYPTLTLMIIGMPIVFLLLFVYVFGGTLGAGLGQAGGRADYLAYVTPGIILMTVASAATATAVTVATDMTEGIVARFRTMAITRASVPTGHVLGSMIQTLLGVAVVGGVAVLLGFRSTTGPLQWLAALGILTLFVLGLTWLSAALGLLSPTVEIASNIPMPLMFLPLFGSGFVPADSMPGPLRWFAEHQPFTPLIETLRSLLLGTPMDDNATVAIAWSAGIALVGYLWARKLYNRDPAR
ncbi:ABC transporter permease [Streptosporangium sp. 'caverna']|uniref:ABC transporter permease n=1 Tax=Streptosporangium sp. 'caverna' TaxID=2202249 RepID=UPI000D7DBD1C|nr:ABC transporter permease [Streptosporangium sp. 'caverna']AWS47616.1 ABC transporter permease [Streptosporangium sp. 'caverna']